MKKIPVSTTNAPPAIGPYSQAMCLGNLIFTSGQLSLNPASGEMQGSTAAEQTEQCLANLKAILEGAGSSLDNVVKILVFLADMSDFSAMNEVCSRWFTGDYPARSCVAVKALPRGALVEIEAIAFK